MEIINKNIRKIRSIKNLNQSKFGELFNVNRSNIGAYEEGRATPKIELVIKIANYFSIPVEDILTKELTVNQILKFEIKETLNIETLEDIKKDLSTKEYILKEIEKMEKNILRLKSIIENQL